VPPSASEGEEGKRYGQQEAGEGWDTATEVATAELEMFISTGRTMQRSSTGLVTTSLRHGVRSCLHDRVWAKPTAVTRLHTEHLPLFETQSWKQMQYPTNRNVPKRVYGGLLLRLDLAELLPSSKISPLQAGVIQPPLYPTRCRSVHHRTSSLPPNMAKKRKGNHGLLPGKEFTGGGYPAPGGSSHVPVKLGRSQL